jgi:hypothetical protein
MSKPASRSVNAVSVSNTKLAACLAALGFPCDCKPLHDVTTGKNVREFLFQERSVRPGFTHLHISIAKAYESGALPASDPMHPLCVMMRAQHNYDRILDMHKGAIMNLRSIPGGQMTEYRRHTALDPDSKFTGRVPCDDLALAAALGGVGLPVRDFEGPEGARRYWLPRHGYARLKPDGQTVLEDAEILLRRSPTEADPLRLALELTDAMHPVVLGYDALHSRAILKSLLLGQDPFLHLRSARHHVILSSDHTGRVIDEISRRIGAPALRAE